MKMIPKFLLSFIFEKVIKLIYNKLKGLYDRRKSKKDDC